MKAFQLLIIFFLIFVTIKSEDKKVGYNILWVRPLKAGQNYYISLNLKVKITSSTSLKKSEVDSKINFSDLYFDSKVTIIDVNDKKLSTCEKHDLISFYEFKDGKKYNFLSKGASIIVRKTDKGKEILVDNKEPEKALFSYLNQIIELNAGGPTYNETMGECKNVLPGGEWDILENNIIESYKAANLIIKPEEIKGKCTFEKIENNKLYFSGNFTIQPFRANVGKGRKLIDSKYTYQLFEIAPNEETKLPIKISKVTKHQYDETDKDKSDITYSTSIEKEYSIKYFETEKEMTE